MRQVLLDMSADATPLSSLTPSTLPFYRRLGYEAAGSINCIRVPCSELSRRTRLSVEQLDVRAHTDDLRRCYAEFARRTTGLIDRDETWWERRTLRTPVDEILYSYGVWENGQLTGYCLYTQSREPTYGSGFLRARGYHYSLVCRDLVWLTSDAADAIMAFAGGNRPLGAYLVWYGPLQDPLQLMCDSLDWQLQWSFPWMARVVDVKSALAARGFPQNVNAAVAISIHDPILSEDTRSWRIELEAGECTAQAVAGAPISMSIGAFSALYTGYLSADQLARAGRVDGANRSQLAALGEIFKTSPPWAMEVF